MASRKIIFSLPVEKTQNGNRTDIVSQRCEIDDASDQDILNAIKAAEADYNTIVIQIRGK